MCIVIKTIHEMFTGISKENFSSMGSVAAFSLSGDLLRVESIFG